MPWDVFKQDDEFCVYKVDEEGERAGESLGCHPTEKEARQQVEALYASEDKRLTPDKVLVYHGSAVKALGDGKVGGYLVRFTSPSEPDLMGDFFDADTNFGKHTTTPVYFDHGMDDVLKGRVLAEDAPLKYDEFGVWVEAQLSMRDEYEKFIYQMAEQGKMGWSSGTASHLVERRKAGKAWYIARWPLGLDASLTMVPADPKASAIPLKSLVDGGLIASLEALRKEHESSERSAGKGEEAEVAEDASVTESANDKNVTISVSVKVKRKEHIPMTPEELTLIEERFGSVDNALKSTGATLAEVLERLNKPQSKAGFATEDEEPEDKPETGPFKSLGEQLRAVADFTLSKGMKADRRLFEVKATGAGTDIPSDGGFLVQQDFSGELWKRAYEVGVFASRARKQAVGANSNGLRLNAIDETSRATGSRYGGLQAYWLAEAGVKQASRPKFRQLDLRLNKLAALVYATDELLADSTALESLIMQAVPEEIAFMVDRAIFSGTGAGMPLGVMNSGALVSVAKEGGQVAQTVVAENVSKMWARMWAPSRANAAWFINQDVEPMLDQMGLTVGLGGIPAYMPPGGLADAPYGRLKGRPVIITEHNETLGTVGDIVLADLSQYLLIDKGGVQVASSIHVQFLYDETAFRFVYRVDGQPIWNAALTPSKGSNTLSPFVALATRS